MKIVLIGAGSRSFGRGQIVDILSAPEFRGRNVTLTLVDESQPALDAMARLAERIRAHYGADITLEATADRRQALPGADYVITAVARQRMALWEQDFRVPLSYGFRHVLGENGGPGAIFHALRSLELIIPICRDVEALCPNALLMNFTNPEARVLHAILHLTQVKAAGFCHGVFYIVKLAAQLLGRPQEHLRVVSAGMNHFYCVLGLRDETTGEDLYPPPKARVLAGQPPDVPPLFRKLAEVFDWIGFPSDDHTGEYLAFGTEYNGVKWRYGQESRPVPFVGPGGAAYAVEDRQMIRPLEDYASGEAPLDSLVLKPSGEMTVPIIADILLDHHAYRPAVNVLNTEGYIANVPRSAAIEIPAVVDARGLHPQSVGELPETFAAFVRTQFSIIELVTEAYRTRSKKLLLQALLLDPCVNSIAAAEQLLDEMLALQKDYLPTFA